MPDNENDDGEKVPPIAYWNADWNNSTGQFENITPAPTGNGRYNMFTVEVSMNRFIDEIPLIAGAALRFQSADSSQLGQGMRFRVSCETYGNDHDWLVACVMTLHRKRTV